NKETNIGKKANEKRLDTTSKLNEENANVGECKRIVKGDTATAATSQSCIVSEIARCREQILLSLNGPQAVDNVAQLLSSRISNLENENKDLKKSKIYILSASFFYFELPSNLAVCELESLVQKLLSRVAILEETKSEKQSQSKTENSNADQVVKAENGVSKVANKDDDDDLDLFGSDEDEAANELREQRLKAYEAKKSKKPEVIAKSSVVLEVKPWDDETDLNEMEKHVRSVAMDGLLWGTSKLVPVAYNVKKLQIVCVVEDDKVSIEELTEKIQEFEDYVQSVDVAAFNKI
ncbi:putative elongation factor 1 delta-like protein, partial [Dinothrombium tinctorium]